MCSSTDFDISETKLLLDELYKVYNENEEGTPCSTCAELISKLSKHVLNTHGHGALQNNEAFQSAPTKSKHNLRSRKQINYSEQVADSIPSRRLPKNLNTPCDVLPSDTHSTSTSVNFFGMDITNPQVKMEDLDLDLNMDYLDCPDVGSEEEETKIDINYLTGGDALTTTVAPDNISAIPSSIKNGKLAKSCPICKRKYLSAQKLNLHFQKSHPGEKSYTCTHTNCGENFMKEWQLKKHAKSHIGKNPFSCDVCGKVFSQKLSLKRHKLVDSKEFICDECGRRFAKNFELEVHKRAKHTNQKPFTCTIAGNNNLYLHMTRVHSESDEMKCTCEVCGKSYKTKNALNGHMIVHSGQKPFVCGQCGKGYFYKKDLENHTTGHTGERAFPCHICPKSFRRKKDFLIHVRTHTAERPFVCEIRNKGFSSKRNLNGHLRSHSDARPFVCQTCDKGFKTYVNLHRHRQIHTKENL